MFVVEVQVGDSILYTQSGISDQHLGIFVEYLGEVFCGKCQELFDKMVIFQPKV